MTRDTSVNGRQGQNPTASRPAASCTDCTALSHICAEDQADARRLAENHATHTGHAVELEIGDETEEIQFATTANGPDVGDIYVRGGQR